MEWDCCCCCFWCWCCCRCNEEDGDDVDLDVQLPAALSSILLLPSNNLLTLRLKLSYPTSSPRIDDDHTPIPQLRLLDAVPRRARIDAGCQEVIPGEDAGAYLAPTGGQE